MDNNFLFDVEMELEEEARVLASVGLVRKTCLDEDLMALQSTHWLAECEEINEAVALEPEPVENEFF